MLQPKRKRKATPLDSFVGAKLKKRRGSMGESQGTLGGIIGVSFQQIQKYEKGIDRLSASDLYKLSKYLKTSIQYFFEGFEPSESAILPENLGDYKIPEPQLTTFHEDQPPYNLDDSIEELLQAYSQISDPQLKRKVIDFAKSLISKT